MTCPFCEYPLLTPDTEQCPRCLSDLPTTATATPLDVRYNELLRQRVALEGQLAQQTQQYEKEHQAKQKKTNRAYFLLLLLPLIGLLCRRPTVSQSVYQRSLQQKDSLLANQKAVADSLRFEVEALEKTHVQTTQYILKKGDTLEDLGFLFFNDRSAGYRIGKDNNIITKQQHHHLEVGDTLLIRFR